MQTFQNILVLSQGKSWNKMSNRFANSVALPYIQHTHSNGFVLFWTPAPTVHGPRTRGRQNIAHHAHRPGDIDAAYTP